MSPSKTALRRALALRRDQLPERDALSAAIAAHVLGLPEIQQAQAVHCYLPIRSEVDTRPLIVGLLARGQRVAVPVLGADGALSHAWLERLDPGDWVVGGLGTLAPREAQAAQIGDWEALIVPLLGFDRRGYRIGYGKGYYDRQLAVDRGVAIGVAFAAQEVAAIPCEPHDQPLRLMVTEREVIRCAG